jgi:hypothetical protein
MKRPAWVFEEPWNARAWLAMSEKDWRQSVYDHARWAGWRAYFTWSSKHSPDGFPDLHLLKADEGPVYVELKTETGDLSPAQIEYRDLILSRGMEWHLWRPRHLDRFVIPRLYARSDPHPPWDRGPATTGLLGEA